MSGRRGSLRVHLLQWPLLVTLLLFLVVPLILLILSSVLTRGSYGGVVWVFTWENYARLLDPVYSEVFVNSVKMAGLTTFFTLVLAYPIAALVLEFGRRVLPILMVMTVLSFWSNFVVRTFALKMLVDQFFGDRLGPEWKIQVGMIANYLPLMLLPLLVAFGRLDLSMIHAAQDLGASSWQVWRRVILPLTRRGAVTGMIFVFAPTLGEFVIPNLMGGGRTFLLGNLLSEQFLRARDWPFGAAITVVLLSLVLVVSSGVQSVQKRQAES